MITLYNDKTECCGCGACSGICPKNAITMQEDEYGFIYPEIDSKKCVECGLCISSCHYKSADDLHTPIKSLAAVNRDDTLLENSASGGMFWENSIRSILYAMVCLPNDSLMTLLLVKQKSEK